jgi:acyl carrier protein
MKTEDKVLVLTKNFSKINAIDIKYSTKISDLKFDSLDLLEFQMGIDDEFGIEVAIDDFLKCSNVSDIVLLVEKYLNQK